MGDGAEVLEHVQGVRTLHASPNRVKMRDRGIEQTWKASLKFQVSRNGRNGKAAPFEANWDPSDCSPDDPFDWDEMPTLNKPPQGKCESLLPFAFACGDTISNQSHFMRLLSTLPRSS